MRERERGNRSGGKQEGERDIAPAAEKDWSLHMSEVIQAIHGIMKFQIQNSLVVESMHCNGSKEYLNN